jgi:hypothetical protein
VTLGLRSTKLEPLVTPKTYFADVYDDTTKVGELTIYLEKHVGGTYDQKIFVLDSSKFEVTNNSYKTTTGPDELIPLGTCSDDEGDSAEICKGFAAEGVGQLGMSPNMVWSDGTDGDDHGTPVKYWMMWFWPEEEGADWEDFFDDPSTDNALMGVTYFNVYQGKCWDLEVEDV